MTEPDFCNYLARLGRLSEGQYVAMKEGKPVPEETVRRDKRGRIVHPAVRVGW